MAWEKHFLEENVYERAKVRIKYLLNNYDQVYFSFSGGKDSLVCIELADEVYKELGRKDKVKVIYQDEEFVPDEVNDFLLKIYHSGRFDFRWYCLKNADTSYILGRQVAVTKWDKENRNLLRPIPNFAITSELIFTQYTMNNFTTQNEKGKKVMVNGMRASESLNRLRALFSSKEKNDVEVQIVKTTNVDEAKVIYDWEEKDIFKYLKDKNIDYCDIYDIQAWAGQSLRVSSSTSVESCKRLSDLRKNHPIYFEQLLDIFPEFRLQEKYYADFDEFSVISNYEKSWKGIIQYIDDNYIDVEYKNKAKVTVHNCMKARYRNEQTGKRADVLFGFPILYVFEKIVKGDFKKPIVPLMECKQIYYDYEATS